jgi:hypothetical protein
MSATTSGILPFAVKDCALIALATGRRAQNLRELRDALEMVQPSSLYHHFWGGLLRPRFDEPEFNNDFAAWARHALHDWVLAERLAVIDPTEFQELEGLRRELIEVIEERLDERELIPWSRPDQQFHFLDSLIVVFDTHRRVEHPGQLVEALAGMTRSSVFYHFIDARRRTPDGIDDFRGWLREQGDGYPELCEQLATMDPFFSSLAETRQRLLELIEGHFGGPRL